jgi:hypothetical protein
MGKAIGDILPLAIGVAISPVPIIAIVLMLGTPRARATGPAFALGWIVGLTLVGTIMLVIATGNAATESGNPETWVSVLKLVLGALFLLLAIKQWRSRPAPGDEAVMPKWMRAIDSFSPGKALVAGVALSGLNPKNLRAHHRGGDDDRSGRHLDRPGGRHDGDLRSDRLADDSRTARHLLRAGGQSGGNPRRHQDLDGRPQRGDHGRPPPRPGLQADR